MDGEGTEPIVPFRQRLSDAAAGVPDVRRDAAPARISFDRTELAAILTLYGSKVADGEWRDYAIDAGRDKAVFSVFRRSADIPLYRIEKDPQLARRQGAYAVVAQGGMILRRGHDLAQVLRVLFRRPKLVAL
jgi:hypothetical protein